MWGVECYEGEECGEGKRSVMKEREVCDKGGEV